MTLIKFQNPKMKSFFETDAIIPDFGNRFHHYSKMYDQFGERTVPVNVIENEDTYLLHFIAPGFKKEDIKLTLEKQVLTVKGDVKVEAIEENARFSRKEFSLSSFKRSFTLPANADVSLMTAKHENGILLVTLPKKQEVKKDEKREIEIL